MKPLYLSIVLILAFFGTAAAQQKQESDNKLDHAIDLYRAGNYQAAATELEGITGEWIRKRDLYLGAAYVHLKKEANARSAFVRAYITKGNSPDRDRETKLKVTKKPKPDLGKAVPQSVEHAVLVVAVEFLADGKIGFVFPVIADYDKMFAIAEKSVRKVEFKPATVNGTAITHIAFMEYAVNRY